MSEFFPFPITGVPEGADRSEYETGAQNCGLYVML